MENKLLLVLIGILIIIACVGVYSFSLNPSPSNNNTNITNATNFTANNSTVNSNNFSSNESSDSSVSEDKSTLNHNDTYYEMVNGEKHYMSESDYAKKYPEIYKERKEGKFLIFY